MTYEVLYDYVVSIMMWFSIWMIFEILYSKFAKTKTQKLFMSVILLCVGILFIFYRNKIIESIKLRETKKSQG